MQDYNNKKYILNFSILYTFSIIILLCIPAYLYMQSEIDNYKFNQLKTIEEYGLKVQRAIYDFSESKSNTFRFPKSFTIASYLLSDKRELIYSTTIKNLNHTNNVKKEIILSKNRLEAKYLIIVKNFSFTRIYLKIAILSLSIGFFVFISGYLIILQSITPYKKANLFMDAFFNDAMHELKTPLGIIQLNLEILGEKKKEKELSRALNAVKNLQIIYEDIEYLIKYKKVNYTKEYINFSNFLKQRINIFDSLTYSKNINFNTIINDDISIFFNRTQLQRIIDNTISNAIKYSKQNSNIDIFLEKEQNIILSIKDYGAGIKDKNQIFNRYYRENHIKGGFGIGLNIVKNICDNNNIKIICISEVKKGSTFKYIFKT